jgi:hypothetical protein
MHRHVRCVGHEVPVRIEKRAGEVEPFLDVHGISRVLKRRAHLLGDVHEEVVEHFEHDRIGFGAQGCFTPDCLNSFEDEVTQRVDPPRPAGFDHRGAGCLTDDGGARDFR